MRTLLLPVVLSIIWLICFAPWVSLVHWWLDWPLTYLAGLSALLTPAYTYFSLRALRHGPDWFAFASMQFLGLGSVGWLLLLPGWLAAWLLPSPLVATAFAIAWIGLTILAVSNANRLHDVSIKIKDRRITDSLRLVQISDVHIGSRSGRWLEKVVERVNSHQPDIVLITGDLLDLSRVEEEDLKALQQLNTETYMCIGNHERYINLDKALAAIRSHGVSVLHDEMIETRGIQVIAVDDADKPEHLDEVIKGINISHDKFSVTLYHRPDGWKFVRKHNLPLMLAGHTHNGQVWPFNLLVKRRYPEIAGLYEEDKQDETRTKKKQGTRRQPVKLYVSSGTGTWGPTMRLGTKCEVTIFDLSND